MPRRVTIRRPERPIDVEVGLPRSKSIANRALIIASLAGDLSSVEHGNDGDDTRILHELLSERPRLMHCGLGGTTFRFLLAWASVQEGEEHLITGDPHLLQRPHGDLVDALRALGSSIERTAEGYLVHGKNLRGGNITLDSPVSSQFISALMLVAPCMEEGIALRWTGRRLSEPYVHMTARCLAHFGARVDTDGDVIRVAPTPLRPMPFLVPRDWSAAAFWFEIAALADDARILLRELHREGWHGDEWIADCMSPFVRSEEGQEGTVLTTKSFGPDPASVSIDLMRTPDLFQPIAVTCAALGLQATITGLDNLPLKETDRLRALTGALSTCGFSSAFTGNSWRAPAEDHESAGAADIRIDPSSDHRMAMCLAPLALMDRPITITDADVVNKSYPGFWEDLAKAGFRLAWDQ